MSGSPEILPKLRSNFSISAISFSVALTLSACSGDDKQETDIMPTQDKVLSVELNEMRHTFHCYDGPYDIDREDFNSVDANVREKPTWIDSNIWGKWQNRIAGENLDNTQQYKTRYFFGENEISHRGNPNKLKASFAQYKDDDHIAFLVVGGSDKNELLKNGALKVSMQRAAGFLPAFEDAGIHPDRVCIVPEGKKYADGGRDEYQDRHVTITAFSLE
ncbi:MAG: hypothetical protein COA45_07600 [Zetaproteobacteria bacterium]|nr:MAG: hypothetical protein COA45_07600 [Zetaproteobacteria bacterium]